MMSRIESMMNELFFEILLEVLILSQQLLVVALEINAQLAKGSDELVKSLIVGRAYFFFFFLFALVVFLSRIVVPGLKTFYCTTILEILPLDSGVMIGEGLDKRGRRVVINWASRPYLFSFQHTIVWVIGFILKVIECAYAGGFDLEGLSFVRGVEGFL